MTELQTKSMKKPRCLTPGDTNLLKLVRAPRKALRRWADRSPDHIIVDVLTMIADASLPIHEGWRKALTRRVRWAVLQRADAHRLLIWSEAGEEPPEFVWQDAHGTDRPTSPEPHATASLRPRPPSRKSIRKTGPPPKPHPLCSRRDADEFMLRLTACSRNCATILFACGARDGQSSLPPDMNPAPSRTETLATAPTTVASTRHDRESDIPNTTKPKTDPQRPSCASQNRPMTIWFLGDCHGGFEHIGQALRRADAPPAALVFLGDVTPEGHFDDVIQPYLAAGIEVFWIAGNHDTDREDYWRNLSSEEVISRNLDGRIVTVAGLRIAGLGGVFRERVWDPDSEAPYFETYDQFVRDLRLRQGLDGRLAKLRAKPAGTPEPAWVKELTDPFRNRDLRRHQSTIFPDTVRRLGHQRADVLVTHEPPAPHPCGREVLARLARDMRCRLHFHGHTHDSWPYPVGPVRTIGVGLRGIIDNHGRIIRPGERDELRTQHDAKGGRHG